ncbi:hypothetical protein EV641_109208 [Rhodococcus sp. SMB37]|uniref:hypothetical protein n=1 Tax=Rhodococcus sp. SMB37 TaxID=2512213 RepID=UPI001043C38D|nr:hypothetical protein [Rhodococcus sp. SMB37]TCN51817.1 hypothetical protein EV641_109208 [Rhodococcus sp. SMB37]
MTATFDNHQHTTDWTDADSAELDAWARTHTRSPLQRDPHLYQLLAPLRAENGCHNCHRPFRPAHTRKADYPDTVSKATGNLCMTCWKAQREGRQLTGRTMSARQAPPTHCVVCQTRMHARGAKNPNGVPHGGRGQCRPCYDRLRKLDPTP